MNNKNLKRQFDALLEANSDEERVEQEAGLLAMQFLSRIDQEMARKGISKKELTREVETSPSFITQLFRGDRKPNWTMLAKMKKVLDLDFLIFTQEEHDGQMVREVTDYHRRWTKSFYRLNRTGDKIDPTSLLEVVEDDDKDFALAG